MSPRPRQLRLFWETQPMEIIPNHLPPRNSQCQELLAQLLKDVVQAEAQERKVSNERQDSINPS
jgi:hypothetical protein